MMTKRFNKIVAGEPKDANPTKTQERVVPWRSHVNSGEYEQKNTDLILLDELVVVTVSFKLMLLRNCV